MCNDYHDKGKLSYSSVGCAIRGASRYQIIILLY